MTTREVGSDLPANEDDVNKSVEELLLQSTYTPAELSALLDVPQSLIEHDAFSGKLKAHIVGHDIIHIHREDAIEWMKNRQ
jgi:hypothetical protein